MNHKTGEKTTLMAYEKKYIDGLDPIMIIGDDRWIYHIGFSKNTLEAMALIEKDLGCRINLGMSKATQKGAEELEEYTQGKRKVFDLPLYIKGTDFQKRVWQALLSIPYGKTWSYKQLAQAAGSPKGYRAAGSANGANNFTIVIPCHRVIAHNGSLGGYGGGLENKKALLALEKRYA